MQKHLPKFWGNSRYVRTVFYFSCQFSTGDTKRFQDCEHSWLQPRKFSDSGKANISFPWPSNERTNFWSHGNVSLSVEDHHGTQVTQEREPDGHGGNGALGQGVRVRGNEEGKGDTGERGQGKGARWVKGRG